jgi:hypothetical protein
MNVSVPFWDRTVPYACPRQANYIAQLPVAGSTQKPRPLVVHSSRTHIVRTILRDEMLARLNADQVMRTPGTFRKPEQK